MRYNGFNISITDNGCAVHKNGEFIVLTPTEQEAIEWIDEYLGIKIEHFEPNDDDNVLRRIVIYEAGEKYNVTLYVFKYGSWYESRKAINLSSELVFDFIKRYANKDGISISYMR